MNRPLTRKEWLASLDKAIKEFDWEAAYKGEQQAEPVAWINGVGDLFKNPDEAERGQTMRPLYTSPPPRQWVELTDAEIKAIAKPQNDNEIPMTGRMWVFVADLMDKLKEKNT